MRLIIDKHKKEEVILDDVNRLEIWVTKDKKFSFFFNQFGELEVNKQTFDSESSTITIKPSVSNQINLI
jgi:hypothetical protein